MTTMRTKIGLAMLSLALIQGCSLKEKLDGVQENSNALLENSEDLKRNSEDLHDIAKDGAKQQRSGGASTSRREAWNAMRDADNIFDKLAEAAKFLKAMEVQLLREDNKESSEGTIRYESMAEFYKMVNGSLLYIADYKAMDPFSVLKVDSKSKELLVISQIAAVVNNPKEVGKLLKALQIKGAADAAAREARDQRNEGDSLGKTLKSVGAALQSSQDPTEIKKAVLEILSQRTNDLLVTKNSTELNEEANIFAIAGALDEIHSFKQARINDGETDKRDSMLDIMISAITKKNSGQELSANEKQVIINEEATKALLNARVNIALTLAILQSVDTKVLGIINASGPDAGKIARMATFHKSSSELQEDVLKKVNAAIAAINTIKANDTDRLSLGNVSIAQGVEDSISLLKKALGGALSQADGNAMGAETKAKTQNLLSALKQIVPDEAITITTIPVTSEATPASPEEVTQEELTELEKIDIDILKMSVNDFTKKADNTNTDMLNTYINVLAYHSVNVRESIQSTENEMKELKATQPDSPKIEVLVNKLEKLEAQDLDIDSKFFIIDIALENIQEQIAEEQKLKEEKSTNKAEAADVEVITTGAGDGAEVITTGEGDDIEVATTIADEDAQDVKDVEASEESLLTMVETGGVNEEKAE